MRIIIADDEPLARKRLQRLLGEIANTELIGEASNGQQAVELCSRLQPDILLLDIRMPEVDGLQAAEQLSQLERPPAIIFTTAYDSHALAAFETQAIAYLLKPIRRKDLQNSIEKAYKLNRAQLSSIKQSQQRTPPSRKHISVQVGNTSQLIPIEEIDYFHAEQKYVLLIRGHEEYVIEASLKSLEEELSNNFVRVHRNALVAINAISGLHRNDKGHYQLIIKNHEKMLEVSRRMVSQLKKQLGL